MLSAQRDHTFGFMMLALPPRWIEVMPREVGVVAVRDWTSEPYLSAQDAPNIGRGGPIHK